MQAAAYVVGPADGPGAALTELARRLQFSAVLRYTGAAHAEHQSAHTPVCFFLFADSGAGPQRDVADAIRFSTNRRIRFSPMIYFADNPSADVIASCINMGFDDVITSPFELDRVRARIERQMGQNVVYYETAGYFGPDRRDRTLAAKDAAETRIGGQFRRLEIVRNPHSGISVLRDEFHTP